MHAEPRRVPVLQGSVMEGRGRKLCGIDASRVRNDILRQTGFLEPGDNPLSSGSVSGGP